MDVFKLYINVEKTGFLLREREIESILTVSNGYIGTRNSLEELYSESEPGTFIADLYVQGPGDEFNFLAKIPDWARIKIYIDDEQLDLKSQQVIKHTRRFDFKEGTLIREWQNKDNYGRITDIKILKYVSFVYKNQMGKLIFISPVNYTGNLRVETGIDCEAGDFKYLLNLNSEPYGYAMVHMKTKYNDKELKIVQKSETEGGNYNYKAENSYMGSFEIFEWQAELGQKYAIKSVCEVDIGEQEGNLSVGFDMSFLKHRLKWRERWNESRIKIKGNEYDQALVDFSTFHLINSGEFSGNTCSIPARNLSGEAYKGHIFWDTEMYLVPFYIFTKPKIARALLMYRYNTLNGARQNAINEGFKGASYAWESTDSGIESAPSAVILPGGEVIPIFSGRYENHISADIAYTIWRYWEVTQDDEFLMNYGSEIVFETARYYESLISKEDDDLYHINSIIGPDEYHELVDDNAYTNYLAAHNFDIAIRFKARLNLDDEETKRWKDYKEKLYMGLNKETGLFEQFKGYYNLEYVDLNEFEPRTVPMDIILGRKKTAKTQVIKQPDVLMFMFLFGERFSHNDIEANYQFYEQRCGHGSSLSPSIHCIIAARVGKTQEAYRYFKKNAMIDIGDEFGNASGGIHIASMGGVWMSIIFGFAGMYFTENGFWFDPHLPNEWDSIEFSIKWRGEVKEIYIDRQIITINGEIQYAR